MIANKDSLMLIGEIGSGKTTVGNYLQTRGYRKFALGDRVKKFIVELTAEMHSIDNSNVKITMENLNDRHSKELYRPYMQKIATEVCRGVLGEDIWCDALSKDIDSDGTKFVVEDVRFMNEYNYFKKKGCKSVRIASRGLARGTNYDHSSETELEGLKTDYVIYNTGTIDELFEQCLF